MKNNSTLIAILYGLFRFVYYSSMLSVLFILSIELFTSDGKIGNDTSPIHHSKGYLMPIKYTEKETNQFRYSETSIKQNDSIQFLLLGVSPVPNSKKMMDTRKLINYVPTDELKFENIEYFYGFLTKQTTCLNVKTSNTFVNIALGFRTYLSAICSLICLYFCVKIFFRLKENNTFPRAISPYLKIIGFVILGQEVVYMLYYILDSYIIYKLQLRPNLFATMAYKPSFEFTVETIILGLTLLLLSSIFKRGNEMESENELTI